MRFPTACLSLLLMAALYGVAAPPAFAQSVRQWRERTEANEYDADAWLGLATAYVEAGEIERAMRAYDRASQLRPVWNKAYDAFGLSLLNSGRAEQGIRVYKDATTRAPNDPSAYAALAKAYRYRGEWKNVIASYEKALSMEAPEAQRGWWLEGLAEAYTYTNQRELARRTLARAAAQDPESFHAHETLAESYMELGDYAGAERAYRDALALTPDPRNTTRLKERLATALMAQGKREEAFRLTQESVDERRREQEQAKKSKSHIGAAFQDAAREQRAEGNMDVALAARQAAIDASPSEPWHYVQYAQDLERVGRVAEATAAYEASIPLFRAKMEAEPNRREDYRRGLVLALGKTGKTEDTVTLLREQTAAEPTNAASWMALGKALAEQQRYSEAAQAYARVESIAQTTSVPSQTRLRAAIQQALAVRREKRGARRALAVFERAWQIYDEMNAEDKSFAEGERVLLQQYAPRAEPE